MLRPALTSPSPAGDTAPPARGPNPTRQRRRPVLRLVEGDGVLDADLTEDARLLYIVGGLMCNDAGILANADLESGMNDLAVIEVALDILDKARKRTPPPGFTAMIRWPTRGVEGMDVVERRLSADGVSIVSISRADSTDSVQTP